MPLIRPCTCTLQHIVHLFGLAQILGPPQALGKWLMHCLRTRSPEPHPLSELAWTAAVNHVTAHDR
jgi:hypothetical protein